MKQHQHAVLKSPISPALLFTVGLLGGLSAISPTPVAAAPTLDSPTAELPSTTSSAIAEVPATDASVSGMDTVLGVGDLGPEATAASSEQDQVTSVSQLTDVRPTDWAFQALQSLVERYGCIVGYPDRTFRGNRALSRYEFAAGVNACLDRVSELIDAAKGDLATKEDLLTIQRLQEEFAAEIATLRGQTDALAVRTETLERQQFSTTTKLFGQVIFGVQGRNSPDISLSGFRFNDEADNINVITNTQLSLYTQLSPRSILLTGLQAGTGRTTNPNQILTNNVLLGYEGDTGGDVLLSDLTYRQLVGNSLALIAGARGVNMVNVFRGPNRIESAGQGPISRLAQRNPILNIGGDGAGVGFDWQISPALSLQGVYTANRAEDPVNGGLFGGENGGTTLGAQLSIAAGRSVDVALNYVNSYSPTGFLGTNTGDDALATANPLRLAAGELRAPLLTNAFGGTVAWRVSPRFTVGGWAGFTTSDLKGFSGNVDTFNWMAFLNFPDLGRPGNLGAIYVGQPPRITNSDLPLGRNIPDAVNGSGVGAPGEQPSTTTHVEAFYRFRVNDNISITPGVIFVFNPNNNANNDTITIGVLRTTFTF